MQDRKTKHPARSAKNNAVTPGMMGTKGKNKEQVYLILKNGYIFVMYKRFVQDIEFETFF